MVKGEEKEAVLKAKTKSQFNAVRERCGFLKAGTETLVKAEGKEADSKTSLTVIVFKGA